MYKWRIFGGPERIRTADLCNANAALYQLSYRPVFHMEQWCPHPDLNQDYRLRTPMFYPIELWGQGFT